MIFASAFFFLLFLTNLIENYKIKWFLKIEKFFSVTGGIEPDSPSPEPLSLPLDHPHTIQPRTMLYIFKSNPYNGYNINNIIE